MSGRSSNDRAGSAKYAMPHGKTNPALTPGSLSPANVGAGSVLKRLMKLPNVPKKILRELETLLFLERDTVLVLLHVPHE